MPSFSRWGVHKQVAEVPRSFGTFHRMTDVVHVLLVLRRVGHVPDESGVPAVNVILTMKQRGGLIK